MTTMRFLAAAVLLAASPAAAQRGPAPAPTHLSPEVLALACAPSLAYEAPSTPLRVTGGQDSFVRRSYQLGDLVTINAGTDNGIEVGQEFYVRRAAGMALGAIGRDNPGVVRTAGWIRVYAVDRRMSLATITYACDTIDVDDYLEPFLLPQVPAISTERLPAQRDNYGRILVGNDRRRTFATGDFFVVDRGSDHGVTVGAQFVVYRDKQRDGNFLFELGEAAVVDVRPESSTLQVILARDAFMAGDYVALRR
ncbi:MAG: hypothetical protein HY657_01815 [Acidobacteria bacterium]|nr:hypothetical protein [Acidobacteriota bacterium]